MSVRVASWKTTRFRARFVASATRKGGSSFRAEGFERAAMLLPRTYAGAACLSALVAPDETGVRVALARSCLSYHEKHDEASAERAAAEHATLEKQLTRELDERLMAHR